MAEKTFWVYMLLCENGSLYTGYTNDLAKRFDSHVNGTASKYTRGFKPLRIAQSWQINTGKSHAMRIERYIKKLSRAEKEEIIKNPELLMVS